ncbi:cytidylate kinase [bacterium A37T11]|nr:cytidylate kinase [bacterium A37T11]
MMAKEPIVVAIDGYSSCGKSTTARALAHRLNFVYADSGALYRAVTLFFLRKKVNFSDLGEVNHALHNIQLDLRPIDGDLQVWLNGEDVTSEIRQMYVSDAVSEVAAIKAVREELLKVQQEMASQKSLVMDGRDIGTTVFPHAQLKIFMTADPKVRAQRRYKELTEKGEHTTYEEVFANLAHRDLIDTTRKESPLVQAQDAIVVDNTHLSKGEQLDLILGMVRAIIKSAENHGFA